MDERLGACVNLLPGAESIYRWEGKIESNAEVVALMKTTFEQLPELEQRLAQLHPYEVPEFVAHRLDAGLDAYFDWVQKSVASK